MILLKSFSCTKNSDLERFLIDSKKAISFNKRGLAKTYLFMDDGLNVIAYYSISLNIFSTKNISKSLIKKLDGIDKNRDEIASYLIAQLGKSSECQEKIGKHLLIDAIKTINNAIGIVGGRFLVIDAINKTKVLKFYTDNNFIAIDDDNTQHENIRMYYPIIS